MNDLANISVAECRRYLFKTQVLEPRCHSDVEGKHVTLAQHYVRQAASLEVEFTVQWAWLLPVWSSPSLLVVCTDDNGKVLADGIFSPTTLRTTRVRLAIPRCPAPMGRRLHVQVSRKTRGQEIGKLTFESISPQDAVGALQVERSQVHATLENENIVCERLHDGISRFGFKLALRMTDASQCSLLTQLGSEIHATIHSRNPEPWTRVLARTRLRSGPADFDWTQYFNLAELQLPQVPGEYQLCFRAHDMVVATRNFSIATRQSASADAQNTVRTQTQPLDFALSAINHRGVTVPLKVVAEDFAAINATATVEVPQPDPLVGETRHSLDLVLYHEGRELGREHRRVSLKPGRRRSTLSLKLPEGCFIAGPGHYRLRLWLDDRQLHTADFEHKPRSQLKAEQAESILQSLRVTEPRLFCIRDGARVESPDVFVTDSAIVPVFNIVGEGFDDDAPGLQWSLTLHWLHLDSGEQFEEHRTLVAKAGVNVCQDLELSLLRPDQDFRPGRYTLQLRKRSQLLHTFEFRILSVEEIINHTEQTILQSLRAEDCRLLIRTGDALYPSAHVPDSAEGVLPELTLRSSGYNRFVPSLRSHLRIMLARDGHQLELASLPVTLSSAPLRLDNVLVKVQGATLGTTRGQANLIIYIGENEVSAFPFRVVSREEILDQVRVSAIRVMAESVRGGISCEVSNLDIREHRAFSIHLEIQSDILAPTTDFAACTLLRTGSAPMGHAQFEWAPNQPRTTIHGRAIQLSQLGLPESSSPCHLTLDVFIGGELKDSATVTVVTGQRITDCEGQLTVDPHALNVDDAEYQAILRNL